MASFPTIPCWGPRVVALSTAAVLTLVPFAIFVFANCATYYECNPAVKSSYPRPHPRYDHHTTATATITIQACNHVINQSQHQWHQHRVVTSSITSSFAHMLIRYRFDIALLFIKTVWTITFEYLATAPVGLAVILFLGSVATLILSLIYMPFYNHSINKVVWQLHHTSPHPSHPRLFPAPYSRTHRASVHSRPFTPSTKVKVVLLCWLLV